MSVIRDVVEVIKDISDYDEVEILKNKPKGSLTRMTKDAVLQFPVIASNSLDIQLIGLVNKALERNFTTLLKIAFSLNSITDERDLVDYIRQFHQNTGLSDREYTSNLVVNKLVNECKIEYKFADKNLSESDKALIVQNLTKDNHRLLREYLSELNLDKLNDKMMYITEASSRDSRRRANERRENQKEMDDRINDAERKAEDAKNRADRLTNVMINMMKNQKEENRKHREQSKADWEKFQKERETDRAQRQSDWEKFQRDKVASREHDKANWERFKNERDKDAAQRKADFEKFQKERDKDVAARRADWEKFQKERELSSRMMPETPKKPVITKVTMAGSSGAAFTAADVTKANEIMPLPLAVKVYIEDGEGNIIEREFMIGVKAVIHPVSSEYMIDSMMDGYRRGKFFFNFIKATTGEIKFFRDFVFMVDNIKTDAMKNASGTNNKWFSFLKRRALLAKFKNTLRMKHQLLPNTSIILSGEEADTLKQQGVDILDPKVARDLISNYFLLSIVIVDPALEIVHIIYDGEENYSSMSVTALNREAKEDKDTKQILSLLKSRPQF